MNIDPDTKENHISPKGMEHQNRRDSGKGRWYASCRMSHFVIVEHQKLFPELADKMKKDPANATNIYSAFLAMLPLKLKDKLTEDLKVNILKSFKLIK